MDYIGFWGFFFIILFRMQYMIPAAVTFSSMEYYTEVCTLLDVMQTNVQSTLMDNLFCV